MASTYISPRTDLDDEAAVVVALEEADDLDLRINDDAPDEDGQMVDKQCKICLGGIEDEEELGRLISPCLCSGTMRVSATLRSNANDSLHMVRHLDLQPSPA